MAIPFLQNLDLNENQLLNFVLQVLGTDPSTPAEGRVWYNSTGTRVKYYDGSQVVILRDEKTLLANADISGSANIALSKLDTDPLARANHTGTQTHTTISDFDAGVQTNRLDQMAAPTASVSLNSQRITNLSDPSGAQDAATKAYVDAKAQGLDVKESVRAATTTNIVDLASGAPNTVDGVSLNAGDRVLVKDQTTGSQNGIYTVDTVGTGANGAWSRAADADEDSEVSASMFVFVEEGTAHADQGWTLTTDDPITVGTTALTFAQFSGAGQITAGDGLTKSGNTLDVNPDSRTSGTATTEIVSDEVRIHSAWVGQTSITTLGTIGTGTWQGDVIGLLYGGLGIDASSITTDDFLVGTGAGVIGIEDAATARGSMGAVGQFATSIGDGAATSYTVTHNLGTRDVTVEVYQDSVPYPKVMTDVEHTDTNNVTVKFASAPSTDAYRVVVQAK